jgi:hypothetical protein
MATELGLKHKLCADCEKVKEQWCSRCSCDDCTERFYGLVEASRKAERHRWTLEDEHDDCAGG